MSFALRSPERSLPPPHLREVADGVYAYLQLDGGWCLNNAGVLLGRERVIVVDTAATRARAERLRDAIASLTRVPTRLLVNTHHHGDHTFGNEIFNPEALIVAHELAREEAIAAGLGLRQLWPDVDWGDIRLEPPVMTFQHRLTVHQDDRSVELIHVGPAHTSNDVVAWLPAERVLFAGDVLLSGCTPFCLMGSVAGSMRAVERLRALEPEVIVCGHGPVAGPELFDETMAYLTWLQRLAIEGTAAGLRPLELAREVDLGGFGGLLDPERIVGNLHRAYAELDGRALGVALDVIAIFGEMVAFNDGRLPVCLA